MNTQRSLADSMGPQAPEGIPETVPEVLTRENFWNELKVKYPHEMEAFCKWIDEYKARVGWNRLFGAHETRLNGRVVCGGHAPKFHQIPIAMQIGIFFQFTTETAKHYDLLSEVPTMKAFVDSITQWFDEEYNDFVEEKYHLDGM